MPLTQMVIVTLIWSFVIEDSTSHWTDADLNAVATYLLSLPAR